MFLANHQNSFELSSCKAIVGSAVVEPLTHHSKVAGSNPATAAGTGIGNGKICLQRPML